MDIRTERRAAGMSQAQLARSAGVPQPNLSAYENGRRAPSTAVLQRIRSALQVAPTERIDQHRAQIRAIVAEYRASSPRMFGSLARQEATVYSDIDLLVDFADDATLLDEIGLRQALTDLLRVPVDVVGSDTLRGSIRERILAEAVPV